MKNGKNGAPVAQGRAATLEDVYIRLLIAEDSVAPGKNNNVTAYLTVGDGVEVDWKDWSVLFDIDEGTAVFVGGIIDGMQEAQLPVTKDSATSANAPIFFTATADTAGKISATVMGANFPDDFGASAKVKYAFENSLAKSMVDLTVNTNFGDGKSLLEFSGRLIYTKSGDGVPGAGITCSIPTSNTAAFQGASPHDPGLAQTDPDGRFSIKFTDTVSVETAITAEDDEQTALGSTTYQAIPAPLLTLAVQQDHAAANGYDEMTLVATLVQKDTKKPYPGSYVLVIDPGSPGVLVGETAPCKKNTDSSGRVSLPMRATTRGAGTATVTLEVDPVTTASATYTFTTAWQGVENAKFNIGWLWKEGVFAYTDGSPNQTYDGSHVYLPSEGPEQCYGKLTFVPTDSRGGALTTNNFVSSEELIAAMSVTPATVVQGARTGITVSFLEKDAVGGLQSQWYRMDPPWNTYFMFGQNFEQSVAPDSVELTCLISAVLDPSQQQASFGIQCLISPPGGRPGEAKPDTVLASTPKTYSDQQMFQDTLTVMPKGSLVSPIHLEAPLAPHEAG